MGEYWESWQFENCPPGCNKPEWYLYNTGEEYDCSKCKNFKEVDNETTTK